MGGLVIQSFLTKMLAARRAEELTRVLGILTFACPNDGSAFMLTVRRAFYGGRHIQETHLRPLEQSVSSMQSTILERIVYAEEVTRDTCPIPMHIYYGESDGIVSPSSARGRFPIDRVSALPGDHFSIIDIKSPEDSAYLVLKQHLLNASNVSRASATSHRVHDVDPRSVQDAPARRDSTDKQSFEAARTIFNVRDPNANFTGREEVLASLRQALRPASPTALLQAITGMGGVGKTELAIEFAHRYKADYEVVWWLQAETSPTLLDGLTRLGVELGIRREDTGPDNVYKRVLRWLEANDNWLLIYDNANSLEELQRYIAHGPGHAIITSRDQAWRQVANVVDVDVWPPDESREFLRNRVSHGDPGDDEGITAVASMLGHLPLALEQAAAYMTEHGVSFVSYIQLFEDFSSELMAEKIPSVLNYEKTVALTWKVSIDEIRRLNPAAVELLELFAFFAPDAIPEDLFRRHRDALPSNLASTVSDPKAFHETVGILYRHSLVRRRFRNRVYIHRLVQQIIRQSLSADERRHRVKTCVSVLREEFLQDPSKPVSEEIGRSLAPHALAVIPYAAAIEDESELADELLVLVGSYMGRQTQLQGVEASLEHARDIATAVFGHENPAVARGLVILGRVLMKEGNLWAARACFEQALSIAEPIYGTADRQVIEVLNNLAAVLRKMGDPAGAQRYLERSISAQKWQQYP